MDSRLPDFFPSAPIACKSPAEAFFKCFSDSSRKVDPEDTLSGKHYFLNDILFVILHFLGQRGLKLCSKDLNAYKACMMRGGSKPEKKLYRVSVVFKKLCPHELLRMYMI